MAYSLDERRIAPWTVAQEKSISVSIDYPFDPHGQVEDVSGYLTRTYLQFLWLPEALMPISRFIPSLSLVKTSPDITASGGQPHSLHTHLSSLLQAPRGVSSKYHDDLPQILSNGGGVGEMEETMMWFAVTHESSENVALTEDADGVWNDEQWRVQFLQRMERREVQIQILLYLFKLSIPGPQPPLEPEADTDPGHELDSRESTSKKGRKRFTQTQTSRYTTVMPPPSIEDRLEAFMDKLSMWQLVGELESSRTGSTNAGGSGKGKESYDRDWIQAFTEDIVERQFKHLLPEQCALLRSKVFPSSPFSDTDTEEEANVGGPSTSRHASVEPAIPLKRSALSRAPSRSSSFTRAPSRSTSLLPPSPALSTSSRTSSFSRNTTSKTKDPRALARSRSRSISVSLAKEQEDRSRAAAEAQSKKRVLNREVSMSRVFKPKPKPQVQPSEAATKVKAKAKAAEVKEKEKEKEKGRSRNLGVTLVEETPVKAKVNPNVRKSTSTAPLVFGQPHGALALSPVHNFSFGVKDIKSLGHSHQPDGDDDQDEWMMDSSPDIAFLNPSTAAGGGRGKSRSRSHSASSSGFVGVGVAEMMDVDQGGQSEDELAGPGLMEPPTPSRPSRTKGRMKSAR